MTDKTQTAFRLDPALLAALDEAAAQAGTSRTRLVADILTEAVGFGTPPMVLGWVAIDRPGDLDDHDCPECGQDMSTPHFGIMSNGTITAVVCGSCATGE